ncbi:hypothetical protein Q765_01270 [Flavobacterium rivuli WB 3.3-2 = DSM 21788]|uniref:DUF4468 domain-containing protein n=2 Tax=Flavobacterium rivuli TaxID=498301 RepID=A0A0A2MA85_9FLAO|nr:hypothetical protein Q765_01270 [Flavobacterium rivuli WB 3.3-2 = DSM 21788]
MYLNDFLIFKSMKKIFFVVLFLLSVTCFAQETNFLVSDSKVVWENVFISSETNIPNVIARHSRLKITSSADNIYKGKGIDVRNTCPGTSDFFKDDLSFDFEIELRDGKYRVTITNMVYSKKIKKQKTVTPAEKYFLTDDALKTGEAANVDFTCLENYFTKLFSMTMVYKNKS